MKGKGQTPKLHQGSVIKTHAVYFICRR